MSCLERRDLYLLYLTDGLEPSDAAELRAHLATGCPTCAASLAESQATLDLLPQALEPAEPPAAAWAKLAQRVAASRTKPRSRWQLFGPVLALAASLAILITGMVFWQQSWRTNIPIAPDAQMISLAGMDEHSPIHGRLIMSTQEKQYQISLADLPPPPPGRTYELWIITTAGDKIPAGTFDVDASGKVAMATAMPAMPGTVAAAAVTDEPPGGVAPPTGSVRVFGALK